MTIEEIKELLDLFNASGVGEIELQRGEDRIRIRKAGQPVESAAPAPPAPPVQTIEAPTLADMKAAADASQTLVKSPIVGTYYDAASPDSPPFVKVGDAVEPGQVLCIIESMKLMNEIEAEVAGVIGAKLVENGRPVEYGEALFAIRPR
jgi:acetyl-CoA carboxylase biotin carboxyl carrier protein